MVRVLLFIVCVCSGELMAQTQESNEFEGVELDVKLTTRLSKPYLFDYGEGNIDLDYLPVKFGSYERLDELEKAIYNDHYKDFNVADSSLNYLGLIHKLTFEWAGRPTAIIKTFEVKNGQSMGCNAFLYQKENIEWVRSEVNDLQQVREMVKVISTTIFWEFYNHSDSENETINKFRAQVKSDNEILNLFKLAELMINNQEKLGTGCDAN